MRVTKPSFATGLLWLTLLCVTGCGGGGGGGSSTSPPLGSAPETGEVTVAITDAEGDFTRYEVDVEAISLRRADGTEVSVLPLTTRIDFAELTEVTELLSVATVPSGDYTEVFLDLDFRDADVRVQSDSGDEEQAELVDAAGQALDALSVALTLAEQDVIRIRPGLPALFSLDFDLDASNEIDRTRSPARVTVEPFLLAMAELETEREHRVRGVLQTVEVAESSFELALRPFRHRQGSFGEVTLSTDAETEYEVNGEAFTGADGLAALDALPASAPVVAAVTVSSTDNPLASVVLAGSSVAWSDADVLVGVVRARDAGALTVAGARVQLADGGQIDRGEVTVLLGPDTRVAAPGVDGLLAANVSVGQRVIVRGEFADDTTLDATAGSVGLRRTSLVASVVEPSPLVVDLVTLAGRRPGFYDFTGTGVSADQDADPSAYEVDAGDLPINAASGEFVRVAGRTAGFAASPPDFFARTIVNPELARLRASAVIGWPEPSATPFISLAGERVDVDLSAARSALNVAGRRLGSLAEPFALVAPDTSKGAYAVRVRGSGSVALYRRFSDFTRAMQAQLDSGATLARVSMAGRYNDALGEFSAARATALFVSAGS